MADNIIISRAEAPGTRTIDMSFSAPPPPKASPIPTSSAASAGAKQSQSPAITLDRPTLASSGRPGGSPSSSFQKQRPASLYRPTSSPQAPARRTAPPPQTHRMMAQPPTDPRSLRGTYQAFANTEGLDDEDGMEDEDDELGGGGDDGFGGGGGGFDDEDDLGLGLGDDDGGMEEEAQTPQPSPGFPSLDSEKSDIIMKLMRLAKRGFKTARSFSMQSDIEEMRLELKRQQMESSLEGAIAFQRKGLVAISGGIEFMNRKFGRGYMMLDGWVSERRILDRSIRMTRSHLAPLSTDPRPSPCRASAFTTRWGRQVGTASSSASGKNTVRRGARCLRSWNCSLVRN